MYLQIKITGTNESFTVDVDSKFKSYGELLEVIAIELEKLCPQQLLRFKFRLSLDGKKPMEVVNDDVCLASLGIYQLVHLLADQQIVDSINGERPRKKIASKCIKRRAVNEANDSKMESKCKAIEENNVKSYYDKVNLIQEIEGDEFPASLIDEFKKSSVSNDFQALLVVIRVLMKEEGFTIQDITDQKNSSVKIDFLFGSGSCKFVMNLIEDSIIIYAIHSKFIRFTVILISSFIQRKPFDSFSLLIYQKLPDLSRQFKNYVVLPLMAEIKRDLGIFDHLRLNNLPVIILIKMMKMLNEKDLLSLSATCSHLNRLGNDNVLWKRLFELKGTKETLDEEDWKTKYQKKIAEEKEAKKNWILNQRCLLKRRRCPDRIRKLFCNVNGVNRVGPFCAREYFD